VAFNPVRREMVESVLAYPWSTTRVHAGREAEPDWLGANDWAARCTADHSQQVVGRGYRLSADLDRLREGTQTGRPFGALDFVAERETKRNWALLPEKRGPKPKQALLHGTAAAPPLLGEMGNSCSVPETPETLNVVNSRVLFFKERDTSASPVARNRAPNAGHPLLLASRSRR
jgi:hypothetical protein